jgi:hypothetical protein
MTNFDNNSVDLFIKSVPGGFVLLILYAEVKKKYGKKILDNITRKLNLPFDMQLLQNDKFNGLVSIHLDEKDYTIEDVKKIIYKVYCICKGENLTVEDKSRILLLDAFKEKELTNTIGFFERIESKVERISKDGFSMILDNQHIRFKRMLNEFKPMCDLYIMSPQAYLMTIMSGACFGAVYNESIYPSCIEIAFNLTLGNRKYVVDENTIIATKFIELTKYLLPTSELATEYSDILIHRCSHQPRETIDYFRLSVLSINKTLKSKME